MELVYLAIPLAPLVGALIAGLFGKQIGRAGAHWVTIIGVFISFVLSLLVINHIIFDRADLFNQTIYTWMISDGVHFEIGFLIDELTALMLGVVSFVSLMVHIYTIGYMQADPGYQRFFSYIALFTFAMFMLVMANNFLQLFFAWEAVGVVSYLLIGFWYQRESAIVANLKAFLINRIGDFGFLLGIALIFVYTDSLNYFEVFTQANELSQNEISLISGGAVNVITLIGILLFIGAMGKSAQFPLQVWLPDSMEGPTPISALIHAATMVTAGIFMVARMSPLYELSSVALNFILIIGAITALLMGILGLVQYDIKRVIAYSTLSQLGYMTAALGASAYGAAIFHLMTHAFFKALLFLAAGSVIIALHHEQDMRKMGGLKHYLPITHWSTLIGSLALVGFPFFSGFFSKDTIIEAVRYSSLGASGFAYSALLIGVFITALYSFRLYFMVFHGKARMDTSAPVQDPAWVVTLPLIALAIPAVLSGFLLEPIVFGDFFDRAIVVLESHAVLAELGNSFDGVMGFALHAATGPVVYLTLAGMGVAYWIYLLKPRLETRLQQRFSGIYNVLLNKYYMDHLYINILSAAGQAMGRLFWKLGDMAVIDGLIVNGSARVVGWLAKTMRFIQTGYLYHYAFAMIVGLMVLLSVTVMFGAGST